MNNGFSITLCIGKYGGFYMKFNKIDARICLGWIALTIYWTTDIEEFMEVLRVKIKRLESNK